MKVAIPSTSEDRGGALGPPGDRRPRRALLAAVSLLSLAFVAWLAASTVTRIGRRTDLLAAGRSLYQSNCTECHGDRGSRIPSIPLDSPQFLAGLGGDAAVRQVVAEGKGIMPAWGKERGGPLSDEQIRRVVEYVLSPDGLMAPRIGNGRTLFLRYCQTCHGPKGNRIPAAPLSSASFLQQQGEAALETTIRDGRRSMLAFGKATGGPFSDTDIKQVVLYLQVMAGAMSGAAPSTQAGPGQELFAKSCAACHGAKGDQMSNANLASKDFLSRLGKEGLVKTIIQGKGGMPALGQAAGGSLSDSDIQSVADYLLQTAGAAASGGPSPAPTAPPGALKPEAAGAAQLFQKTCAGCHSKLTLPKIDPTLVRKTIEKGIADKGMPAFAGRLSDADLEALVSYVASGQAAGAQNNGNPFSGVVQHVSGWITRHPTFVKQSGSQLCLQCHQLTFCSGCHTATSR